ncbi:hypothetical protein [Cupriavidus necator]
MADRRDAGFTKLRGAQLPGSLAVPIDMVGTGLTSTIGSIGRTSCFHWRISNTRQGERFDEEEQALRLCQQFEAPFARALVSY